MGTRSRSNRQVLVMEIIIKKKYFFIMMFFMYVWISIPTNYNSSRECLRRKLVLEPKCLYFKMIRFSTLQLQNFLLKIKFRKKNDSRTILADEEKFQYKCLNCKPNHSQKIFFFQIKLKFAYNLTPNLQNFYFFLQFLILYNLIRYNG